MLDKFALFGLLKIMRFILMGMQRTLSRNLGHNLWKFIVLRFHRNLLYFWIIMLILIFCSL